MKKIWLFSVGLLLASMGTVAQPTYEHLDTIMRRCDRYYYHDWFDECIHYHSYGDDGWNANWLYSSSFPRDTMWLAGCNEVADGQMAVKGIVALLTINDVKDSMYFKYKRRNEEYVMLIQNINNGSPLATVRWDTVTPYLWRLPLSTYCDSIGRGYLELHAYEVYFDEPVIVEDEFLMLGTHRSNYDEPNDGYPYTYYKTDYAYLNLSRDPCIEDSCLSSHRWFISEKDKLNRFDYQEIFQSYFRPCGPFLAIVDYYDLEVRTADSTLGQVEGGGRYPAMSRRTIAARPAAGYRFVQWNDSVTDNPRVVTLAQDTLLTASFAPATEGIGTVDGGLDGITLSPNPTSGRVDLAAREADDYRVELYDSGGRRLKEVAFSGRQLTLDVAAYPAGTYFLRVSSAQGSCTLSFIKQ